MYFPMTTPERNISVHSEVSTHKKGSWDSIVSNTKQFIIDTLPVSLRCSEYSKIDQRALSVEYESILSSLQDDLDEGESLESVLAHFWNWEKTLRWLAHALAKKSIDAIIADSEWPNKMMKQLSRARIYREKWYITDAEYKKIAAKNGDSMDNWWLVELELQTQKKQVEIKNRLKNGIMHRLLSFNTFDMSIFKKQVLDEYGYVIWDFWIDHENTEEDCNKIPNPFSLPSLLDQSSTEMQYNVKMNKLAQDIAHWIVEWYDDSQDSLFQLAKYCQEKWYISQRLFDGIMSNY